MAQAITSPLEGGGGKRFWLGNPPGTGFLRMRGEFFARL
jgi:hypothetical protein